MIRAILPLFLLFHSLNICQEITTISVNKNNDEYLLPSYNSDGSIYFSLTDILDILGKSYLNAKSSGQIAIDFADYELSVVANNPFLIIKSKSNDKSQIIQLPTSIHYVNGKIFVPLIPFIKLFKMFSSVDLIITNPNKLFVTEDLFIESNILWKVDLKQDNLKSFLNLKLLKRAVYSVSFDEGSEFSIVLRNTSTANDIEKQIMLDKLVEAADVTSEAKSVIIKMKFSSNKVAYEIVESENVNELKINFFEREESDWYERESEHFKIIYRVNHAPLVNHILSSAENSLKRLM
ncbi:MAG: hypothetical protein P8X91_06445, partial [Candidatus Bathyarchaeota archaeon]